MTYYVTTAIPYVNAPPHLGHALELVQADVLARHRRSRGEAVRFLTGTDDNALKNVTAARAAGIPVERSSPPTPTASPTCASRWSCRSTTSSAPAPTPGTRRGWPHCGCDQRRTSTGTATRACTAPAVSSSRRHRLPGAPNRTGTGGGNKLVLPALPLPAKDPRALESGRVRIEPPVRRNEVLAFVRSGLRDISVSRPATRAGGWGIPVPGDPEQVIYVWWDALANYVTALGDGVDLRTWWQEPANECM